MNDGQGCGPLYAVYLAARAGDTTAVRARWTEAESVVRTLDAAAASSIAAAVEANQLERVHERSAALLFRDTAPPTLSGPISRLVGALLWGFGYVAAFVLFLGARTPESIVGRLRWAYRTVGVSVEDTESVDGVERTVFRCPYRNIGASRWGERRLCHDVLDRVDDGYVTFLRQYRGIDYDRPRACSASDCCYSTVTRRK